jgi:hypothetical protein
MSVDLQTADLATAGQCGRVAAVQGSFALLGDGGLLPSIVSDAHGAQILEARTLWARWAWLA